MINMDARKEREWLLQEDGTSKSANFTSALRNVITQRFQGAGRYTRRVRTADIVSNDEYFLLCLRRNMRSSDLQRVTQMCMFLTKLSRMTYVNIKEKNS